MIPLLEQTQKNALIYKKNKKKYLSYNFETYKFVKITYYISLNQLLTEDIRKCFWVCAKSADCYIVTHVAGCGEHCAWGVLWPGAPENVPGHLPAGALPTAHTHLQGCAQVR